jgi:hypothetical protein
MASRYFPGPEFRVRSKYKDRTDPFTRKRAFHAGIDFAAPEGTEIPAATDGEVVYGPYGAYDDRGNNPDIIYASDRFYSPMLRKAQLCPLLPSVSLERSRRISPTSLRSHT